MSEAETTLCGVPQGSVLGPLLFLLYINDIYKSSSLFAFYLFADDTSIILANNNLKELESLVNRELGNVNEWLKANKLSLNIKKSNFVIFRPRQKNVPFTPRIRIFDSVTNTYANLEVKDYVKYLGLMIDSNLSWKYHTESICHKISKSMGIIAKIGHYVPRRVLLSVYNSLIVPSLTYGICGWGNCALTFQRKIVTLQNGPYVLFTSVSVRNTPYPSFSNRIAFPYLAYFSEIVAIYCMISTDRQHQLVYSISLLKQVRFITTEQDLSLATRFILSSPGPIKCMPFSRESYPNLELYSLFDYLNVCPFVKR